MQAPLQDVVALVVSKPLGPVDTKHAIAQKLKDLGARVAPRLSKEVTHIIFQRIRSATPDEQVAEESELRGLYGRTAKMDLPVFFVSPLWVQSCLSERRRVLERAYIVPPPANKLFTLSGTPGSGSGSGIKKPARRHSFRRKADEYEVDVTDAIFSSSQQIRGGITAGREVEEVASPMTRLQQSSKNRHKATLLSAQVQAEAAMDCDASMSGTQIAAEMLTGLGNDLSTGAQEALMAMKDDVPVAKGRRRTGSGKTPAAAKRPTRPYSAVEPSCATGSAKKKARGKGSQSAPQPTKRGAAPKMASRLKPKETARPARCKRAAPGTENATLEAPAAVKGANPIKRFLPATKSSAAQPSGSPHENGEAAGKLPEAPRIIGLRDVKSRVEMQMPILKAQIQQPSASPVAVDGPAIPVPEVRRVESPWTAVRPVAAATPATAVAVVPPKRPTVWSQPRPWDPTLSGNPPAAQLADVVLDSDEEVARESKDAGVDGRGKLSDAPTQGCLALSSVEPEITELAKAAVKRLRSLRLCPEGSEDRITHLIVDKERRTLKVLLAIANGAYFAYPSWLTSSLDANWWLPLAPYEAKVRYSEAAERARQSLAGPTGRLLEGKKLHIHSQHQPKRGLPDNGAALRRIATALGAKVVFRRDCEICIVSSPSPSCPEGLPPGCQAFREEWLLDAAEHYQLPQHDDWRLPSKEG